MFVELTVVETEPSPFSDIHLRAPLAAEPDPYMTEKRFAQVTVEMTQDEVRAVLGEVGPNNVREFDDGDIVAWAYPREEEGYAAVVFFGRRDDGNYRVYLADFDVVTSQRP